MFICRNIKQQFNHSYFLTKQIFHTIIQLNCNLFFHNFLRITCNIAVGRTSFNKYKRRVIVDGSKGIASFERIRPEIRHAFRKDERCELSTIFECTSTDCRQSICTLVPEKVTLANSESP